MSSFIHRHLLLASILFFILSTVLVAQSPPDKIAFEKFGVAEGLPEEFARDVIQDEQGFIWITTQNGIVKYDGYTFKVFRGESSEQDGKLKSRGRNSRGY